MMRDKGADEVKQARHGMTGQNRTGLVLRGGVLRNEARKQHLHGGSSRRRWGLGIRSIFAAPGVWGCGVGGLDGWAGRMDGRMDGWMAFLLPSPVIVREVYLEQDGGFAWPHRARGTVAGDAGMDIHDGRWDKHCCYSQLTCCWRELVYAF